ncbi:MAG: AAA family ATPase [Thermodesulfobacteriota bacterium]
MQIKKLILENFQSYLHEEFNFHPLFNVIIGRNSSGKSAIVRATAFILYGQWDTTWVREGVTFCRITLETDTGIVVIREKGASVNKYIVQEPNKLEQVYENFGTSVPEQIEDIFNIRKVQIDAKDYLNLNISNQHDGLFLIPKPGSFKAKVIGKLSDVHLLDYSLREINKDKRALSAERKIKLLELERLEEELKPYEGLDEREKKVRELEHQFSQVADIIDRVMNLKKLNEKTMLWKNTFAHINSIYKALDFNEDQLEKDLTQLESIEKIQSQVDQIEIDLRKKLNSAEYLSEEEKKTLNEYMKVLESTGACPTCFTNLNKEQLQKVKENL